MKTPAVFFDRDNTLIVNDGYLADPAGVKLAAGAADAVARARAMGFKVVTCSNQSGVARGMFTEDAVVAVNKRMEELLRTSNPEAIIDRHEFCPFHPEGTVEKYRQESELRKPRPGMMLAAAKALQLDLDRSWVIGDAARDIEAGHAAGCRTILVSDPKLAPSPAALEEGGVEADETVASLSEAMDVIEAAAAAENAMSARGRTIDLTRGSARLRDTFVSVRFSTPKLLAGITQMLAIAVALASIVVSHISGTPTILFALFLEILTVALLMMGMESKY
jgi:D-glycero-D-manno-heptose 1,7-bisphosphate phosphatase